VKALSRKQKATDRRPLIKTLGGRSVGPEKRAKKPRRRRYRNAEEVDRKSSKKNNSQGNQEKKRGDSKEADTALGYLQNQGRCKRSNLKAKRKEGKL